jgi:integrase
MHTPDTARTAARAHLTQRAIGHDPAERRAARRHAARVLDLIEAYLENRRGHMRASSLHETERQLRKYAVTLHGEPVSAVTRARVFELHRAITASSGPIQANRVLAALSSMFVWAMRAGLAESNPAAMVPRNAEVARERVLSDAELAAIWRATGTGSDYARIIRLLMLTGCRREEIGGLRWDEIESGVITLAKDRTKTGVTHEVSLTGLALAQLPARTDRDFVFGLGADAGFSGWSKAKGRLDASLGFAWRLHDLRRTLSTRLNEAGIDPHIVEALLGHAVKGVAGVYNKARYVAQRREALQTWAEHIAGLIGEVK